MKLKKDSWHAKMYKHQFGRYSSLPDNICDYFWCLVWSMICLLWSVAVYIGKILCYCFMVLFLTFCLYGIMCVIGSIYINPSYGEPLLHFYYFLTGFMLSTIGILSMIFCIVLYGFSYEKACDFDGYNIPYVYAKSKLNGLCARIYWD